MTPVSTLTVREEIAQAADAAEVLFTQPVRSFVLSALYVAEQQVDLGKLDVAEGILLAVWERMRDDVTNSEEDGA